MFFTGSVRYKDNHARNGIYSHQQCYPLPYPYCTGFHHCKDLPLNQQPVTSAKTYQVLWSMLIGPKDCTFNLSSVWDNLSHLHLAGGPTRGCSWWKWQSMFLYLSGRDLEWVSRKMRKREQSWPSLRQICTSSKIWMHEEGTANYFLSSLFVVPRPSQNPWSCGLMRRLFWISCRPRRIGIWSLGRASVFASSVKTSWIRSIL